MSVLALRPSFAVLRAVPRVSYLPLSTRAFSSTSSYRNQDTQNASSSKDPQHPHLWYHTLSNPPPGRVALSFLPNPPKYGSRTVLGYLPLIAGSGLNDLMEEPRFLEVLHSSIRSGLESGKADTVTFEAATRPGDGYIHITDERAVPPAGRIGETEDLIGSVFVQDGKIVASTYEPFPAYRLVTSNGPLVLPRGLDTHLIEQLEQIDAKEQQHQ